MAEPRVRRLERPFYARSHRVKTGAHELDTRNEISHVVRKRDLGLKKGFVNRFDAAGDVRKISFFGADIG